LGRSVWFHISHAVRGVHLSSLDRDAFEHISGYLDVTSIKNVRKTSKANSKNLAFSVATRKKFIFLCDKDSYRRDPDFPTPRDFETYGFGVQDVRHVTLHDLNHVYAGALATFLGQFLGLQTLNLNGANFMCEQMTSILFERYNQPDSPCHPHISLDIAKKRDDVDANRSIRHDDFQEMVTWPSLTSLNLSQSLISDLNWADLSSLGNLTDLSLSANQFTDGGMSSVSPLIHLTKLNLSYTGVTGECFHHLAPLTKLKEFHRKDTPPEDYFFGGQRV